MEADTVILEHRDQSLADLGTCNGHRQRVRRERVDLYGSGGVAVTELGGDQKRRFERCSWAFERHPGDSHSDPAMLERLDLRTQLSRAVQGVELARDVGVERVRQSGNGVGVQRRT
ncbi:Uncharacterised protein [Mycobacterium tuberculosis]|nr:Uncharacterised protein [Mycobacterium tuberculosis]